MITDVPLINESDLNKAVEFQSILVNKPINKITGITAGAIS